MQQKVIQLSFILTFLALAQSAFAQARTKIPNTTLYIDLSDEFELGAVEGEINGKDYRLSFLQVEGVSFEQEKSDFDNVEVKYLERKNIVVENKIEKKIGSFNVIILNLETKPDIMQIFLGNDDFCTFINVTANDSLQINEASVERLLNTLEYKPTDANPLEDFANFQFTDDLQDWKFSNYAGSVFAFENTTTDDIFMILQLPPSLATLESKKYFANEMLNRFSKNFKSCKVLQEQEWNTDKMKGYRMIFEFSTEEEVGYMYMFVFGSTKNLFLFQGISNELDEAKTNLFNEIIEKLDFKL